MRRSWHIVVAVAQLGCRERAPATAAGPVTITATVGSTRFVTRDQMIASGELQISGEPLAEAMKRDLRSFSRDRLPTDLYYDRQLNNSWTDLAGFASAVESYEYSRQPMNNLAFESGAGTSLAHGPLVGGDGGLAALVQHFAAGSHALGRFVAPTGNPLGWPGLWPTVHVFRSFDPAIAPTGDVALGCALSSDDNPAEGGGGAAIVCADYECDATSLHLPRRAAQVDPTITPGADGFATWKYGLWVINYLQSMHDAAERPVATGDAYLGSSDVEGFQAQLLISEIDNRAADWLGHLTTADGRTLSGFADVAAALAYDHTSPLRWFPGAIAVTETDDGSGFPRPGYALASADSELLDLVGMIAGHAEIYAITDRSNPHVGGAAPARVFFDGDPFPESALRDRALAMLRVAMIDLDRLHTDPASGWLVDTVTMAGATPHRGHTISTISAAYTVLGLRTALRAISSQLALYSNNTPDTAISRTPLDAPPLRFPADPDLVFGARVGQLERGHARLLLDHLTDATGRAWSGWDVAARRPIDDRDELDAHAAAIRGLFAGYLATGDVRYRDRAIAVFERMQAVFYDPDARIYGATPAPVTSVEYTPMRFALLQSALRDTYQLVASRPGNEPFARDLEARIARLDKLVLNGWDDRDRNRLVAWPAECVNVVGGLPRGGLQMAERTLSGEIGSLREVPKRGEQRTPTSDREHDCVPEIDDARLPAALAASVTFHVVRP